MTRVAIIEPHRLLVEALALTLQMHPDIELVGQAHSASDGYAMVKRTRPAVVLLDLVLPDGSGLDVMPRIAATCPNTKVVVLANQVDDENLLQAIDFNAAGFITKDISLEELLVTIKQVTAGRLVMPTEKLVSMVRRFPRPTVNNLEGENITERLTPREYEILVELARGQSGEAIASGLNIAPLTVRTHIRNIMSKMGVHSRLEAVTYALSAGIIEVPLNGNS